MKPLLDGIGRKITDLRLSVTDRCNFYCSYCRDAMAPSIGQRSEILSFEEIYRMSRILVGMGIEKIRLTGGEPLLRRKIEMLVRDLSGISGLRDLAMTTNGYLLKWKAAGLREAGLRRINFSMDSTREERFDKLVGCHAFAKVLDGLQAALAAGFDRVRLNTVLIRGMNDDEILDFVEFGKRMGAQVRFIEFMPLGEGNRWRKDLVVTAEEILAAVSTKYSVLPIPRSDSGQTSREYHVPALDTIFGIIPSVSIPFCDRCSRIRITADGHLRTCLFSASEADVKKHLRSGVSDDEMERFFRDQIYQKEAAGHQGESPDLATSCRRMPTIGG